MAGDEPAGDLFEMQDEITARLARTVGIELIPQRVTEQSASDRTTWTPWTFACAAERFLAVVLT
jgi:hypothetical protein